MWQHLSGEWYKPAIATLPFRRSVRLVFRGAFLEGVESPLEDTTETIR